MKALTLIFKAFVVLILFLVLMVPLTAFARLVCLIVSTTWNVFN